MEVFQDPSLPIFKYVLKQGSALYLLSWWYFIITACKCVCKMFFSPRRTTDDDSTTQRKVNLLLERINKLKWRTAENVEEEEKVSVGVSCLLVLMFSQSDLI